MQLVIENSVPYSGSMLKKMTLVRYSIIGALAVCAGLVLYKSTGARDSEPYGVDKVALQAFKSEELENFNERLRRQKTSAFVVYQGGKEVFSWYGKKYSTKKAQGVASMAKAVVGASALSLAMERGYLHYDQLASDFIESWKSHPQKSKITIGHLASHQSGLEDSWDQEGFSSGKKRFDFDGWKGDFWKNSKKARSYTISRDQTPMSFEPGTSTAYSNPGFCVLSIILSKVFDREEKQSATASLRAGLFKPLGIGKHDWRTLESKDLILDGMQLLPTGGQSALSPRGLMRIGQWVLDKGSFQSKELVKAAHIEKLLKPRGEITSGLAKGEKALVCSSGWWSNSNSAWPSLPKDAVVGVGAGHQLLIVIPSKNMVVLRLGESLSRYKWGPGFWKAAEEKLLAPFDKLLRSPAYPKSKKTAIRFAPSKSIKSAAKGSDNWIVTELADGSLLTAYGDGWGFDTGKDNKDGKKSMALAKIHGGPMDFRGENLSVPSMETLGDGSSGAKISGLLRVNSELYAWVRNLDNSQLAVSKDGGAEWKFVDWKWESSFGHPSFLSYGNNYEGAKDNYVYSYSLDNDSAYVAADQMVLARVEKTKIADRAAYEFYAGLKDGEAQWSKDLSARDGVFKAKQDCWRGEVSYHQQSDSYLWCQILKAPKVPAFLDKPQFENSIVNGKVAGLAIYKSPNPWGPWECVFHEPIWDVDSGENARFPTKWMSTDSNQLHLIYSGNDHFNVRPASLIELDSSS